VIIQSVNKEALAHQILKRYEELKSARSVKEDIWLQCGDAYLCQFPEIWRERARKEKRSARYVGMSFDAIESNHSAILSMLMPGSNWLGLEPATPGHLQYDDEAAKDITSLLHQQHYQIKFKNEISLMVKQAAIMGNAPYTVGWRKDHAINYPEYEQAMAMWQIVHREAWDFYNRELQAWEQAAKIAQQQGTPPPPQPSLVAPEPPPGNAELAYSGPSFETGSIFDYLVDPYSPDPSNPLVFKRSWVSRSSFDALSEKNNFGYSVYDHEDTVPSVDRKTGHDVSPEIAMLSAFGLQAPPSESIEIIECWGTIETNKDSGGKEAYTSFVGAIANRGPLVRFEPTFLWSGKSPNGLCKYRNVPGQVYGIGALEPVLGLQDLINVRVNQLIDIVSFSVNPEYKAVDDGLLADTFVSAPNKIHWVGNVDNLVPLQKDFQGLNAAMADVEMLKQEFRNMVKSVGSGAGPSDESATKTRQSTAAIGGDLGKIATYIEDSALAPIIDMMIEMNAQYLPKGSSVRSMQDGQPMIKNISPEALRKGWVCRVTGTRHTIDKQENLDKLMMFTQLVMGSPLATSAVDLLELLKKIYSELEFGDEGSIFHDEMRANEIMGEMIRSGMLGNNTGMSNPEAP
jgi:hypothetical protein